MSAPKVLLETDDDLEVGEFGIATRMVQQERRREEAADEPEPMPELDAGATMIYASDIAGDDTGGVAGRARPAASW